MSARLATASLLALSVAAAPAARAADEGDIPAALQAAIFAKVLSYDRSLEGSGPARVLVAHRGSPGPKVEELVRAFAAGGIDARSCRADQLPPLDGRTVVYVTEGAESEDLRAATARGGSLSISGTTRLARDGEVSVALFRKPDGRTGIAIHLGRARAERHEFTSYLLGFATIWR